MTDKLGKVWDFAKLAGSKFVEGAGQLGHYLATGEGPQTAAAIGNAQQNIQGGIPGAGGVSASYAQPFALPPVNATISIGIPNGTSVGDATKIANEGAATGLAQALRATRNQHVGGEK